MANGSIDMNSNKIKRVYVDTSVVGGVFEQEFQQRTKPLWNAVRNGTVIVIVSDILADELVNAPIHVQEFFARLPAANIERVSATEESNALADQYIAAGVVGKTSRDDCRHIALVTFARADVLVSWNFKHIVNMQRIQGYNGVNLLHGYQPIEFELPMRCSMTKSNWNIDPIPGFSCVQMKRDIQAKIYEETKDMTPQENLE